MFNVVGELKSRLLGKLACVSGKSKIFASTKTEQLTERVKCSVNVNQVVNVSEQFFTQFSKADICHLVLLPQPHDF